LNGDVDSRSLDSLYFKLIVALDAPLNFSICHIQNTTIYRVDKFMMMMTTIWTMLVHGLEDDQILIKAVGIPFLL